jgi:hypothetical protein
MPSEFSRRWARWVLAVSLLLLMAGTAHANEDDPYAYGLRLAAFPVHFQAGVSQSHFGSAARAQLDLGRWFGVEAKARFAWLDVAGEDGASAHDVRGGLTWHVVDEVAAESLAGTIYPQDTPAVRSGGRAGTDHDLEVPVSQKLGGPRLAPPERDTEHKAVMRNVHSLRLGYDHVRAIERGRPDNADGSRRFFVNTMHVGYLGYGWGTHWNLDSVAGGGQRELGWRRIQIDLLFTLEDLLDDEVLDPPPQVEADLFLVGVRASLEGAIDALASGIPGLGFAYELELGALPGRSGLEGYLFVGLGVELDVRTRRRVLVRSQANASSARNATSAKREAPARNSEQPAAEAPSPELHAQASDGRAPGTLQPHELISFE